MSKRDTKYSLNQIKQTIDFLECTDVHHTNKQVHDIGDMCKALYALQRHLYVIEEALRSEELI